VRHHQHGLAVFRDQLLDQGHHFVGALAVQVAGGLVAQKEGWVGNNRSGNGHALFLAAGKLAGEVVHAVGQANDAERGFHVLAPLGLGELGQQERQLHVLERGEHRNQVVHLEDEPHVARAPSGQLGR
jgi:acyl-CoA thioesterase-1